MEHLSKLHHICKKCKHKEGCNDKRMIGCLAIGPSNLIEDTSINAVSPIRENIKISHTPITINMGEYGTIDTSLEEIQKQIGKDMLCRINNNFRR